MCAYYSISLSVFKVDIPVLINKQKKTITRLLSMKIFICPSIKDIINYIFYISITLWSN